MNSDDRISVNGKECKATLDERIDMETPNKKLTIYDVANELGVSPSTVSRAISGKGRIGEETRERILQYIQEQNYYPSAMAQGLAQEKTNNIALILPEIKTLGEMPFFQTCMYAVAETAQLNGYDMIVSNRNGVDNTNLERLIKNRKVDGMILSRTYFNDTYTKLLSEYHVPYVTIGQIEDSISVQIDHNHLEACQELTSILLSKGLRKIAYLGFGSDQMVNGIRYQGYVNALMQGGIQVDESIVYRELDTISKVEQAVETLIDKDVDCMLCQDDAICAMVLGELEEHHLQVPEDIKIASCYYSKLLDHYRVGITSLQFDAQKVGRVACQTLLKLIDGQDVPEKTLLDYEVRLKESTK